MLELITLVDKNDTVIGPKERSLLQQNDIHRVAEIWITNDNNQLLLAKRALTKRWGAGLWGPSAAGLVKYGETYKRCALREVEEELGITITKPLVGPKELRRGTHSYIVQHFFIRINEPADYFKINVLEVACVDWFTISNLAKRVTNEPQNFLPFIHSALAYLQK